jgi:hypothetical protein
VRSRHVTETVEAEAVPAALMRALLRANIESLLPEHALTIAKVEEESARSFIEPMAMQADNDRCERM